MRRGFLYRGLVPTTIHHMSRRDRKQQQPVSGPGSPTAIEAAHYVLRSLLKTSINLCIALIDKSIIACFIVSSSVLCVLTVMDVETGHGVMLVLGTYEA